MRFYVRPGPLKRQLSPLITHGGGVMCRVQEPGAFLLAEPGQVRGVQYIACHYITDCVRSNRRLSPRGYRLLEPNTEGPLSKRPRKEAGGSAGASPTPCDLGPGKDPPTNPIGEASVSGHPITSTETPESCGPNSSTVAPASRDPVPSTTGAPASRDPVPSTTGAPASRDPVPSTTGAPASRDPVPSTTGAPASRDPVPSTTGAPASRDPVPSTTGAPASRDPVPSTTGAPASRDPVPSTTGAPASRDPVPSTTGAPASRDPMPSTTGAPASRDPVPSITGAPASRDPVPSTTGAPASRDPVPSTTGAPASRDPVPSTTGAPASRDPMPSTTGAPASRDPVPSTTGAPTTCLPRASVRQDGPGAMQIVDDEAQTAGAVASKRRTTSHSLSLGRQPFSRQEDIAILEYVLENEGPKRTVTGTLLWKELEQEQLLRRTWQAMKCRYTRYIMWHKHLYKPPPRAPGQRAHKTSTGQQGDATTIAQHLPPPDTALKSLQQDPREVESGGATSKGGDSVHPGGSANRTRATDVTLMLVQEDAGPSSEGEEANTVSAAAGASPLSPQKNLESDNSEDLQIFKLANMEFEVDDDYSDCQVKVSGISLKDFVMGADSESAGTQMQEDDVTSSPDSEGLQDALTDMMREFSLDICQVTQALLKNNGEVGSTRHFLRTGRRPDGFPIWQRKDDVDLQNSDAALRPQLARKYGADNVAKRVAFLAG
ncbi:telomeric repeat-binding factor 2-interacting protein 1 [Leptodactylus fuscus]|uniref:telomeric repeat-binding factor 2-interacting protein 1 n=1 Tax=Leptodactylus fuscus TaxID=238119 RepID=UPI003F4ED5DC